MGRVLTIPPIPTRGPEWCAYREGTDFLAGYGWGATEDETLDEYLANSLDEELSASRAEFTQGGRSGNH